MRPAPSVNNIPNGPVRNAVLSSQSAHGLPGPMLGSNSQHGIIRQFCLPRFFSASSVRLSVQRTVDCVFPRRAPAKIDRTAVHLVTIVVANLKAGGAPFNKTPGNKNMNAVRFALSTRRGKGHDQVTVTSSGR
jgi:hypothetical protein